MNKKTYKERRSTEPKLVVPDDQERPEAPVLVPEQTQQSLSESMAEASPYFDFESNGEESVSDKSQQIELAVRNIIEILASPQNEIWLCLVAVLVLAAILAGAQWWVIAAVAITLVTTGICYKNSTEANRLKMQAFALKVISTKRFWLKSLLVILLANWLSFTTKMWLQFTNYFGSGADRWSADYLVERLFSRIGFVLVVLATIIWLFNRVLRNANQQLLVWFNYSALLVGLFVLCLTFVGVPPLGTADGFGHWFVNWLNFSMVDANLSSFDGLKYQSYFYWLIAAVMYFLLSRPVSMAARAFAVWSVQGRASRSGNILSTFCQTMDSWCRKILVKPAHPVLKYVMQSALTYVVSYVSLYLLVICCPGGIGEGLRNWLGDSLAVAVHQKSNILSAHPGMLYFMAGLFALWGAVPFGLMSLAFLPPSRAARLELHPWGLYHHCFWATLPFSRPMRFWQDFKSVSLAKGKSGTVKLQFFSGGTIKLCRGQISDPDMLLLLSSVDEYSPLCTFDQGALELISRLARLNASVERESKRTGKTYQRKYSAMIFEPLASGDTVCDGKLRVVRQLSSKPLSAVYLVRTGSSQLAVLKQFALPYCVDDSQSKKIARLVADFETECQILKQIDNPLISKVLDTFSDGGSHYMLLDYAPGRDLLRVVQEHGVFGDSECARIAIDVAEIMVKLHSHAPAILHRDLTPDNLVITPAGAIRLIDFGSAHQFVEGITGTLVGKQAYIAPEQLRGKATVQSDIYSFGCCLYYLATGKEPVALTQCDARTAGASVSCRLNELIMSCTAFEAADRPASFVDVIATLKGREALSTMEDGVL
ncbi:MAG: serine/threonine protein kinase [Candidatus Obscuribacter sp.]|nr:serine/threonine protein kinase [Candidatus Obscuribacter sp.]